MRRFRNSFFALAASVVVCCASAAFAQSAEDLESPAVNRVATKLNCPCGCKTNMACRMDPYPCQTCWNNKKKILTMQKSGMSDEAIFAAFQKEMGDEVLLIHPGVFGSVMFYAAAIVGLFLVVAVIKRYLRKGPAVAAGPVNDPILDKYQDEIEKEVDRLG